MTTHPDQDTLLAFAGGQLGEIEAENLYEHMADCLVCVSRMNAIMEICSDFESAWNEFQVVLAPEGAAARQTVRAPHGFLTVRCLLDSVRGWVTLAGDPAAGLATRFLVPFAGTADSSVDSAAWQSLARASDALASGNSEQAFEHLRLAAAGDSMSPGEARLQIVSDQQVAGEILVNAGRNEVNVIVYPAVLDPAGLTIHLEGDPTHHSPAAHRLEPVEGASYWAATLDRPPDGLFRIVIRREP
jgi:hypothetical protein